MAIPSNTQPNNLFILPEAYPREKLEDVTPLANPIAMQVDPASICNFRCDFCPTGDSYLIKTTSRKQMFMQMNLYEKILSEISEFDRQLKTLRLYKDGEPLLHPEFIGMVKAAKAVSTIDRVETTSNGSKLSPEFNQKLVDAGLDRIVLSIEGMTAERYLSVARVRIDMGKFVENIRHLSSIKGKLQIHIKTLSQNLDYGKGEDSAFLDTFGPLADGIYIENTVESWPSFQVENTAPDGIDLYGRKTVYKSICPYIFYSLSINSDGTVSPCCVDWNRELVLGSVESATIMDIWHGEKLNSLRRSHIVDGLKNVSSCNSCGQVHLCTHDNLDPFRDQLKERFEL